jgi:hypothetical protein
MPSSTLYINDIALDNEFFVWASGQDIRKYNGTSWEYYNGSNSAVPQASPYYLDTRSISIDTEGKAWVGVAQGPTSGFNESAVFWLNTKNVTEGEAWNFSDLGTFSLKQEISLIYACPFGDDILAFSTPLNGVGGTGASAYTRFDGVTGGRLFHYLKETDQWKETAPGYSWPHIYSIATKGDKGSGYYYYLATAEGLMVVPQGILSTVELTNGLQYLQQATVYNTHTSGILSDKVYCLSFDEDGNLWAGTDSGLSFYNGEVFWNYPLNGPVTSVQSRPNGHVFYAKGDGELSQGTGVWHFNGTTHNQINSSNSTLQNNQVLDIEILEHNVVQGSRILHENSFWILEYNYLSSLDYDLPHVYASSKYAGATGWNFTYYSPTGGAPNLPKVNKYTWTYPEWMVYDNEYLAEKHPGLDPRNLFLTTKLQDIADGRAGAQPYWNNWPVPFYEDDAKADQIATPAWDGQILITNGTQANINVTSSTVQEFQGYKKYYVSGTISPPAQNVETIVQFGFYSDSTPATLTAINPSINVDLDPYNDTFSQGKTSFIVCYSEAGTVDSILPFKGNSTEIQSICSSPDGNYIYAGGIFNKFIEIGDFLWSSQAYLGATGATGAPVGITNSQFSLYGATAGYTWIYPLTDSGTTSTLNWTMTALPGEFANVTSGFSDFEFTGYPAGTIGTWETVSNVYLNYEDSSTTNQSVFLNKRKVGSTIAITLTGFTTSTAYYRIDAAANNSNNSITYWVTYQNGATGPIEDYSTALVSLSAEFFAHNSNTFPYTKLQDSLVADSSAYFVAKIGRDLGNIATFSGVAGDFNTEVRTSYRVSDFRHFPVIGTYNSATQNITIDSSKYYLNIGFSNNSGINRYSTLKNLWDRTGDFIDAPTEFGSSTFPNFISYMRLTTENFSLIDVETTPASSAIYFKELQASDSENSVLLTGVSNSDFSMLDINLTNPIPSSSYPFYIITGQGSTGATGAFIDIGGTSAYSNFKKISCDKDTKSHYFVSTVTADYGQGLTGSFFGQQYVLGSTGQNFFVSARITEQGQALELFTNPVGILDRDMQLLSFENLNANQNLITYQTGATGLTGFNVGYLKINMNGKNLDSENLGQFYGPVTSITDSSSNLFSAGVNWGGLTGGTAYINVGATSGFNFLSKQFVPELGINLGNIISRPGSGAWTWCDVNSTQDYLKIPILSTVVFNNYASNIYGKQNNVWSLTDAKTLKEILNVKSTPYFIYTFTDPGYYTIYNKVEDSWGNVYEISKPGFIEIVDHKVKRPDDRRPDFVDSNDYGYPQLPFSTRDYEFMRLSKDLAEQEAQILITNTTQFGSAVVIPGNPDSTFDSE